MDEGIRARLNGDLVARKKHSEEREAKRFAVILAIALPAIAVFSLWRGHGGRAAALLGAAALVVGLSLGAFSVWMRFFRLWMRFALALSWVMTRVILSVFFFLVLTPVGLVMRILGKAPLDLAWKDGKRTYWIDKPVGESTVGRYEKSF
jgi:hypothetical protein